MSAVSAPLLLPRVLLSSSIAPRFFAVRCVSTAAPPRTHYEALGVSPGAAPSTIKLAFYEKAKLLHPDTAAGGGEAALAAFRMVNDAYAVLGDADARAAYDAALAAGGGAAAAAPRPPPPKPLSLRLRNEGVLAGLPPPDVPNSVWPSVAAAAGAPPAEAFQGDEGEGALPRHRGPAGAERAREAAAFKAAQLRAMEREAGARMRATESVSRLRRAPAKVVEAGSAGRVAVATAAALALTACLAALFAR